MGTLEEEKILWRGSPSQLVNVFPFILAFIILGVILYFGMSAWTTYDLGKYNFSDNVAIVVVLIPIIYMIYRYLKVKYEQKEVTSKTIKIRRSIINKAMRPCHLFRVKDMEPDLPWYMSIFGLGSIQIVTSDDSDPVIRIRAIRNAQEVHDVINEYVKRERKLQNVQEIDYK